MAEAGFLAKTVTLARKDLTVEARSRDTLLPTLVFAIAVTLLLAFSLPEASLLEQRVDVPAGTASLADVLSGFLWVTILFAGLIGFARTFENEREEGAIDALLLVPLDRSGLFAAKALANLAGIAIVEAIVIPLFLLLFGIGLGGRWAALALVVALVDVGFVAVGTLFSAVAAHTRSRELILPVLALPTLVPLFLAATELSSDLFLGVGPDDVAARGWFAVLVVFDVVAVAGGALTFEFALD